MKLKALFRRRLGKPKSTSKKTKPNGGPKKPNGAGNTNGVANVAPPPASPAKGTPAKTGKSKTASPPPASPTSVAAAFPTTSKKSKPAVDDFDAKVFQRKDIEAARKAGPVDLDDDQDYGDADTTKGSKPEEEQHVPNLMESLAVALPPTKAADGGKAIEKKAPKKPKKIKGAAETNTDKQKDKPAAVDKKMGEEEEVRDYDTNVTRLFAYLHQRKWTRAVEHIITEEGRREASVWVARYQAKEEEKKNEKEEEDK